MLNYTVLKDDYLQCPTSQEDCTELADQTFQSWHFPNACVAADGKHIALFHPFRSGSEFYNYKGFFSIVLMALIDRDYKFRYVDDGDVFRSSSFFMKRWLIGVSIYLP